MKTVLMYNKFNQMKKLFYLMLIPAFLISCKNEEVKTKKTNVEKTIKVRALDIKSSRADKKLSYSGLVEAYKTIPLSFQSTGIVKEVLVDEGDMVKKNQLLAKTDDYTTRNALKSAEATYNRALDAQQRLKKVYDAGSLPEIKWVEINSQLAQAKANVDILNKNLQNCELRAPEAGYIGRRNIEPGMLPLQIQSPLELVKINKVYVKISVPENEIILIKKDAEASIRFSTIGSEIFIGKVEKIGIVADNISRTYEVKILLDNQNLEIKPGMVCSVDIKLLNDAKEIILPLKAVLSDENNQPFVWKINSDNQTVSKTFISFKGVFDNSMLLTSGLKEGDKVVLDGNHKLNSKSRIRF